MEKHVKLCLQSRYTRTPFILTNFFEEIQNSISHFFFAKLKLIIFLALNIVRKLNADMPLSKMSVITPWKIVWSPSFWLKQQNTCICFLTLKTRSFINLKVMWSKHLLENVWLRPEAGFLTPRLILLMLPLWIVVQVIMVLFFSKESRYSESERSESNFEADRFLILLSITRNMNGRSEFCRPA